MTAHSVATFRRSTLPLAALALAGSASAIADEAPLPPPRPPELATPAKPTAPPPAAPNGNAASACLAKLVAAGASAEAAPAPPAAGEECGIDQPVRLSSIGGWAYKVGNVFSETFRTRQEAHAAAERAVQEQRVPGQSSAIEYEDSSGRWHEEEESGDDRPHTDVKD